MTHTNRIIKTKVNVHFFGLFNGEEVEVVDVSDVLVRVLLLMAEEGGGVSSASCDEAAVAIVASSIAATVLLDGILLLPVGRVSSSWQGVSSVTVAVWSDPYGCSWQRC